MTALAFTADGTVLASGSEDKTIRLWDLTGSEPKPRVSIPHGDLARYIAFSPDGKTLAGDSGGPLYLVRLWDLTGDRPALREQLSPWSGGCQGLAFAPDGKSVFLRVVNNGAHSLQQWFSPTDMRCWPLPKSPAYSGREGAPIVAADGRHVLLGNRSGGIHVLRIDPRSTAYPPLEADWVRKIAALPAEEQFQAVREKCRQRNPNMEGSLEGEIEGGVVVGLNATGRWLFDATPLQALPLRWLFLDGQPIADLSPLRNMKLKRLYLHGTAVSDLTPLVGMPLKSLSLRVTKVTDLRPLQNLPLEELVLGLMPGLTNLEPLKGLPLQCLTLDFKPEARGRGGAAGDQDAEDDQRQTSRRLLEGASRSEAEPALSSTLALAAPAGTVACGSFGMRLDPGKRTLSP